MRRLFSVFVLCGAASGVLPLNATAQEASLPKALEPLSRVGRALGLGWGDGYHACDRDRRLPTADLPPRSYAASHALHPHYGQSNRQHWQAAAATNTPPTAYRYPAQPQPHRPVGSGPQFAVPPSVMQEIRSLENDPQQTTPAQRPVEPPQSASEPQLPEQIAPPAPVPPSSTTPAPSTPVRSADVLPRSAAPSLPVERMQQDISEELDTMLDSIVDGPLDDGDESLPADEAESADDLLLDDSDDLLLDDQTRASGFIREPIAGAPRPIPASQRLAERCAQQQLAARRVAGESSAGSR